MNWPGRIRSTTFPRLAPAIAGDPDEDELPDEPMVDPDEPEVDDALAPAPGFIAGEPEVVDPDPVAVGRSVEPDDEVWANAGAAASAVAIRQAAMGVLIIESLSWSQRGRLLRVLRAYYSTPTGVISFKDLIASDAARHGRLSRRLIPLNFGAGRVRSTIGIYLQPTRDTGSTPGEAHG